MRPKIGLPPEQQQWIAKTESFVEKLLYDDATGHDYHHILRVRSLARQIAIREKADLFVVDLAALLHDVDDPKLTGKTDSDRVAMFLASLDSDRVPRERIHDIIATLSYSSHLAGKRETTLEGRIVQDADRLDAIGAIGIARCFAFGGSRRRPIYAGKTDDDSSLAHFYQKLLLLPDLMNTRSARRLAANRNKFMKKFLDLFHSEWEEEHRE